METASTRARPILSLLDIARAEETQAAMALRQIARESIEVAGGVAGRESDARRGESATWPDRAEGIGMSGPVSREEVDRLVAWYAEAGLPAQVRVSAYADASLWKHLGDVGFVVQRMEQVLFRPLVTGERFDTAAPAGMVVCEIEHGDDRAVREVGELTMRCFTPPHVAWVAAGEEPPEREVRLSARGVRRACAVTLGVYAEGRLVGTGGIEFSENVLGVTGGLYAAVVDPAFRKQGVQRTLLMGRMAAAVARGASVVMVGSDPGGPTERNARRVGFEAAYTKVMMTRPVRP